MRLASKCSEFSSCLVAHSAINLSTRQVDDQRGGAMSVNDKLSQV